jgi:hypothetical protein
MSERIKCFFVEVDGAKGLWLDGETWRPFAELPVGGMYFADWYKRKGTDGHSLIVRTPGGDWLVDQRASNCSRPNDDVHRCWVRHGTPPNVTVDKNGNTCGCGCSIGFGPNFNRYHGFLRDGWLVPA